MPPKARYTKEQIIDTAYALVRKYGVCFLTARSLASELGTSTAPIFTAFESIDEVIKAVVVRAKDLYKSYIEEGLAEYTPSFKGTGLKYIQFAKDEPELFKLLFMQDGDEVKTTHYLPQNDVNESNIRGVLENSYGYSSEKAKRLYNHMSVYAHGLAVLYAQRACIFTEEDVSRMLTEVYIALTREEK